MGREGEAKVGERNGIHSPYATRYFSIDFSSFDGVRLDVPSLAMLRDNVIYVDFRLSKDIRDKQELSFAERMKAHSERIRRSLCSIKSGRKCK